MIADTINRFIGRKPPDVQNSVPSSPHPPIVIAAIADTHSNLKVSLRPESFMDDDGGTSIASKVQFWLLDRWKEYIESVKQTAVAHPGAQVYVIGVGDLLDIDLKDRSGQCISRLQSDAMNLAEEVQRMIQGIASRYFLIRGTEAHTGLNGTFEEILGQRLNAERDPLGRYSWQWWTGIVNGVYIEASHHAVSGRRQAARAGAIARLAEDTILEYAGTKDRIPDLVLRGHVHQFADSNSLVDGCRAITLPCWTFANAYVHRLGLGINLPDIGGSIIVCENGRYEVTNKLYKPARREPWQAR